MNHALVTGSSRGIGLAIARKLLGNGYRVTGTRNNSPFPENMDTHDTFNGIKVDLADSGEMKNMLEPLIENDPPDVLINNAGIINNADFSINDRDWLEVWDRTLTVNLRAAAILSKWFVNAHLSAPNTGKDDARADARIQNKTLDDDKTRRNTTSGIIINIASRAAYRGDTQEYAAYAASKGGMAAFTKSMARDFSRKGILAYTVAPGFIETDMAREAVSILGEEVLTRDSAFDEVTRPEEVANLVTYLSSGEVRHMSGSTFHINGGSYMV